MNGNSAKFYDKAYNEFGSVWRGAETTLNAVADCRVYRPKEGGPEEDPWWRTMRKGIADPHRPNAIPAAPVPPPLPSFLTSAFSSFSAVIPPPKSRRPIHHPDRASPTAGYPLLPLR